MSPDGLEARRARVAAAAESAPVTAIDAAIRTVPASVANDNAFAERLRDVRTCRGEAVDHDAAHDALRMLRYCARHEPGRDLTNMDVRWHRNLAALDEAGLLVEPARDDAAADCAELAHGERDDDDASVDAPAEPRALVQERVPERGRPLVAMPDDTPPLERGALFVDDEPHLGLERTSGVRLITSPLEPPELANLRESGLTDATIIAAGFATWRDPAQIDRALGWPVSRAPRIRPGDPTQLTRSAPNVALAIPCFLPGADKPHAHRLRMRHPRAKRDRTTDVYERDNRGRLKSIKYESPRGLPPPIFFGPRTPAPDALRDPSKLLLIVEGEKKLLCAEQAGFAALGLPGIDNMHDATARATAQANGGHDARVLRSEILDHVVLAGRERVVILFDEWRTKECAYLADLARRCAESRSTGTPLEQIPPRKHPAREPRAAAVIARMLDESGVRSVRFASPPRGDTKGLDDVYVYAGLAARGLTVERHDLTVDAALSLDHAAGAEAVLALVDSAVDPFGLVADLKLAECAIIEGWDPEPIVDVDVAIARQREREAARKREREAAASAAAERERTASERTATPAAIDASVLPTQPLESEAAETDAPLARVHIRAELGDAHLTCAALERALAHGGRVFQRGGRLVRVTRRAGRAPAEHRDNADRMPRAQISLVSSEGLGGEIARCAELETWNPMRSAFGPSFAPPHLTRMLLDLGEWPNVPELVGVIEVPTVARDGRVISASGFDADSGLYLVPRSDRLVALAVGESLADAQAAYAQLARFVGDFPFAAQHDVAAWIACVATIAGRFAVDGPVPAFVFGANTKGLGKTFLSELGAIIAAGYGAVDVTLGRADEREKAITGAALRSTRVLRFDNIRAGTPFADEKLEQSLTTGTWSGRLLGLNEIFSSTWRTVVCATGIALQVGVEMSRRVVPCTLDSGGVEHPEDRGGFARPDILAAAVDEHPRLLAAVLAILRAHSLAGRPTDARTVPLGGFASWDRVVRQAILWASGVDPLGGREALRERVSELDPDAALLRALHGFGERRLGTGGPDPSWWCTADIAAAIAEPAAPDAFAELRGAVDVARERRRTRSLGPPRQQAIAALVTPLVGAERAGFVLRAAGNAKQGRVYRVDATR